MWSISYLVETDIGGKGNDTLLVEKGIAQLYRPYNPLDIDRMSI
jgi:hypothetical protein